MVAAPAARARLSHKPSAGQAQVQTGASPCSSAYGGTVSECRADAVHHHQAGRVLSGRSQRATVGDVVFGWAEEAGPEQQTSMASQLVEVVGKAGQGFDQAGRRQQAQLS